MHFLRVPEAGPVTVQRQGRARRPLAQHGQRPASSRAGSCWAWRWAPTRSRGRARSFDESPMPAVRRRRGPREPLGTEFPARTPRPSWLASRCSTASARRRSAASASGRGRRLARPARGAPARRARGGGSRGRLVPRTVAAPPRACAGTHDRPDDPFPGARSPSPIRLLLGPLPQPPRARRLLRGGRRAVGARRHPRRPVPPARPAAGREGALIPTPEGSLWLWQQ